MTLRLPIPSFLDRAGRWYLTSGIQERIGGVARYYRADTEENQPISTEITGYAASTLVYLHSLTSNPLYLERAVEAARFLTRVAWDSKLETFPFEYSTASETAEPFAYFFDCGIIIRGLLSVWRVTGNAEFLEIARACGHSMARDFADDDGVFHPILALADKQPVARGERWSRSPGCYQLKAAMGWYELFEATGGKEFETGYNCVLDYSLRTYDQFLPGDSDRERVMDRLHAFAYFLEGLLPRAGDQCAAPVLCDGIHRIERFLRDIAPSFERSDVYAQLLRARIFAEWAGIMPVDRLAAEMEAETLAQFQFEHQDFRIGGGFHFGRRGKSILPHVSPVSTSFGLQALALWQQYRAGHAPLSRHLLI